MRRLIGNHPSAIAPVPPHLFEAFMPLDKAYRKSSNASRSASLLSALMDLCNHPFSNWELSRPAESLAREYSPQTVIQAIDAVYQERANQDSADFYVAKENSIYRYFHQINRELTASVWVHLYRDPRDVVASWLTHRIRYFTATEAALVWKREQEHIRRNMTSAVPRVSYESLVTNPRDNISDLFNAWGMHPDSACFENTRAAPESNRNVLWKELASPVSRDKIGTWRNHLTLSQSTLVERICCEEMSALGYDVQAGTPIGQMESRMRNIMARGYKSLVRRKEDKSNTSSLVKDRELTRREIVHRLSRIL